jgi:hypothetical protein
MAKSVLALGLDPIFADLMKLPGLTTELIKAFIDSQLKRLGEAGYEVDSCLVDLGETAEAVLAEASEVATLRLRRYRGRTPGAKAVVAVRKAA